VFFLTAVPAIRRTARDLNRGRANVVVMAAAFGLLPFCPACAKDVCCSTEACPRSRPKPLDCGQPKKSRSWPGLKIRPMGFCLLRQAAGFKFWTLPGGKVKRGNHWSGHLKEKFARRRACESRWGRSWACWIEGIKMQSLCFLSQFPASARVRLTRSKRKSGKRPFKYPCQAKLRHLLNTSGLRGEAQSRRRRKLEPPRISFQR
jgi:hypothetical protein